MKKKPTVLLLFGGQSAEHEVSIRSARNIHDSLDRHRYEPLLVYITRSGTWYHLENMEEFLALCELDGEGMDEYTARFEPVFLVPGQGGAVLARLRDGQPIGSPDVVFPVLHGPYGEDGTVQGLLKLLDLPCVGAGVTGSAIGMDKDVMKRILRDGGIPIPRFLVFDEASRDQIRFDRAAGELGVPLFVKPANLGSSVGITMVDSGEEFTAAVGTGFRFDRKIIIEEYVSGREVECSVLGNEHPTASLPGEVIPRHQFYSYDAKYIDEQGADLVIPADLDEETRNRVQELAVRSFVLLCCEGLARVDFFIRENGEVLVNEINTIPGFTNISMYPKLWEASGIPQYELVDRLITLALERFEQERVLGRERDHAP
jgi:D-alanine-D-alanine ligase